ncbi:MAG TPA: hypothetical protein VGO53_12740 [Steroidobacteraceae bacterium]|nr:hypothetical protein [Steroidobacteraceae bacterium]
MLGPFTGFTAPLHPDNVRPKHAMYYGTDLGWSYRHAGQIQFLFGDTIASESGDAIDRIHDDAFGYIDLAQWSDASRISRGHVPPLRLAQIPGTSRLAGLDPGVPMEALKTPLGGFSNGVNEFGLFLTGKPQGCRVDADCSNGLTCDTGLGYLFEPPEKAAGLTLPCVDGAAGCAASTLAGGKGSELTDSGLCVDHTSTITGTSEFGRVGSYGIRHLVGMRSADDPRMYTNTREWLTNKFTNVAARTVADFVPERGAGRAKQDYRNIPDARTARRVFLWGRPGFVGINARQSTLGLYFAYVDMPDGGSFSWQLRYYTGADAHGVPRFSTSERDAAPLDLDSSQAGIQSLETHDIVQQMSIAWIEPLRKWVMFYGGGISEFPIPGLGPTCGVLEIFARRECKDVVVGNGALRMRTADDPWGPWTPPQDLLVGGFADHRPLENQYAPGGVLHHPGCTGANCEAPSAQMRKGDYGWFYGANIIEEWTRPVRSAPIGSGADSGGTDSGGTVGLGAAGSGAIGGGAIGSGVEVIWNVSTWNPYRLVLLKTRITPPSRPAIEGPGSKESR